MYLMDTCVFLWFLEDDASLSERAKNKIIESEYLYLSIVSLWEIAIKKAFINLVFRNQSMN